MSGWAIGSLLASAGNDASAVGQVPLWRCTYDVTDARAQVGRQFGDGSVEQGRKVIRAIVNAGIAWINKVREIVIDDETNRKTKLRWELMRTLQATLSFMNFRTGEIIATYEMIAKAADCCRLTAIRHMAMLRRIKWIDWVRRAEPGGDGAKSSWAPNAYFFEIDRLPLDAQAHLRKMLHSQGITLQSHPDRRGSGPVPNRVQRLAERVAKGFAGAAERISGHKRRDRLMDEAAFVRAEMEHFGDIPEHQWAALRYPGDLAAQEEYNRRLGLVFDDILSNRNALDSGHQE